MSTISIYESVASASSLNIQIKQQERDMEQMKLKALRLQGYRLEGLNIRGLRDLLGNVKGAEEAVKEMLRVKERHQQLTDS